MDGRSFFLQHLRLLGIPLSLCGALLLTTTAHAQEIDTMTVKVRVETKPAPTKAIGLLLSTSGASQIADTTIQKVGDKLYDVIFSVNKAEVKNDSVATAMAISAGGDLTFANVTPALLDDQQAQLANIPECPSEDTSHFAKNNQLAPLKALVDIRADRADLAQRKISRAMDDELLTKLRRLEEAFGINHAEELSTNLPADELVDRLSRLNYALKQYQTFKNQNPSGTQNSSKGGT